MIRRTGERAGPEHGLFVQQDLASTLRDRSETKPLQGVPTVSVGAFIPSGDLRLLGFREPTEMRKAC